MRRTRATNALLGLLLLCCASVTHALTPTPTPTPLGTVGPQGCCQCTNVTWVCNDSAGFVCAPGSFGGAVTAPCTLDQYSFCSAGVGCLPRPTPTNTRTS